METLTKICSHCRVERPLSDFCKNKRGKYGVNHECKGCGSERKALREKQFTPDIIPVTKVCTKCDLEKQASEFLILKHTLDRLSPQCKRCTKEQVGKRKGKLKKIVFIANERICGRCKLLKPSSLFNKCPSRVDGLSYYCKSCDVIIKREKRHNPKRKFVVLDSKTCSDCKQEKPIEEFSRHLGNCTGFSSRCKACHKEFKKNFKAGLTEEEKIRRKKLNNKYSKDWAVENKDRVRENSSKYYKENKHKFTLRNRIWQRRAYKNNPQYRLAIKIRHRIRKALKGVRKYTESLKLLGCTVDCFKNYLIAHFTPGMTEELLLKGEVTIDHIIPCKYFDQTSEEEQHSCFNWRNSQPMWRLDNIAKRARLDYPNIIKTTWGDSQLTLEERKQALRVAIAEGATLEVARVV